MRPILKFSPVLVTMLLLMACAGTQHAYQAAKTLPDTAYVVAEHYSAVVHEAADLKETGNVPAGLVQSMQQADAKVKPLIIGDPSASPPTPGLKQLADSVKATQDATTQEQLQQALDHAVLALSDFMKAVSAARSHTS
jgi:hypothetical protein